MRERSGPIRIGRAPSAPSDHPAVWLAAELIRLESERDELTRAMLDGCPADLVERAEYDRLRREREERRDAVEERLGEVRAALASLEEGTYGRCDRCGRAIGAERLAVLPLTLRCVRHASE
jgi:RNA polymerase-binding transcription factor DksA